MINPLLSHCHLWTSSNPKCQPLGYKNGCISFIMKSASPFRNLTWKSDFNLPWNPEVFLPMNKHKAKIWKAREPRGTHIRSLGWTGPTTSCYRGFRVRFWPRNFINGFRLDWCVVTCGFRGSLTFGFTSSPLWAFVSEKTSGFQGNFNHTLLLLSMTPVYPLSLLSLCFEGVQEVSRTGAWTNWWQKGRDTKKNYRTAW